MSDIKFGTGWRAIIAWVPPKCSPYYRSYCHLAETTSIPVENLRARTTNQCRRQEDRFLRRADYRCSMQKMASKRHLVREELAARRLVGVDLKYALRWVFSSTWSWCAMRVLRIACPMLCCGAGQQILPFRSSTRPFPSLRFERFASVTNPFSG